MSSLEDVTAIRDELLARYETLETKSDILKSPELKQLLGSIRQADPSVRAEYGQVVNALSNELKEKVVSDDDDTPALPALDVTAPFDINGSMPAFLPSDRGTSHPISKEIAAMADIFYGMGFQYFESREIDDQYHMFDTLNFPKDHPARDDYDTFMTEEKDSDGNPFVAPAHTSTMQNRIMRQLKANLETGDAIAAVSIDRVFRNEDLDARHEHTFYQCEGIYVSENVTVGMLIATLKTFLEAYFDKPIDIRINPFYFPFTEPSFEFSLSCPFCDKKGCSICSHSGWIELLGCGMIHPNVLEMADIDSKKYTGFAWGCGIERLIMMKNNIEDIRHFHSAKLDFLEQL